MKFVKMQGAGNDYVYIDCLKEKELCNIENLDTYNKRITSLARNMSNRNFGVGSDGLILIKKGKEAPFMMEMYNADGSISEMCGNGLRCLSKYVYDERLTELRKFKVETGAGIKEVEISKTNNKNLAEFVKINMGKPEFNIKKIPAIWNKENIINEKIPLHSFYLRFTALSMGNPHCVIFVEDKEILDELPLDHYGKLIEYMETFPNRTNVEFVYVKDENEIYQRTWERGSGETLACGSGACASVVAGVVNERLKKNHIVNVHLNGGDLKVKWEADTEDVYLEGEAVRVFNGEWLIEY